jgi:hypothetical protein
MIKHLLIFLARLLGFSSTPAKESCDKATGTSNRESTVADIERIATTRYRLVEVPRFRGASNPPPFSWVPCHPSTMHRFKAQMKCPRGHGLVLKGHSIDAGGRVHPSVVCLMEGCDFHEFVRLSEWEFGALKR